MSPVLMNLQSPGAGTPGLFVRVAHILIFCLLIYTAYQQPMQVDPTAPEDIPLSKRGNMHNIMGAYLDSFYTMVKYIWLIPPKCDMIKSFRREQETERKP